MINKYVFGSPIETFAFVLDFPISENIKFFSLSKENDASIFTYELNDEDRIYGLGETMGLFSKRGKAYESFNLDNTRHREDGYPLYGSHNFFIVEGKETFGVFFDNPGRVKFDFGSDGKNLVVTCLNPNMKVYIIENKKPYSIVKEFLNAVGQSNIPPLWAFGFIQSRWGYKTQRDIEKVVEKYEQCNIPLDGVCMDIDYMDRFIDFTVNKRRFPNLKNFSSSLKEKGIHLIPIIDAGVKIEPGNITYDTGVKNDYFVKNHEGNFFKAAVWPGLTHFPDFFKDEVREWFGKSYGALTSLGIEGFWNDMNEPAIFYSEYTQEDVKHISIKEDFNPDARMEKRLRRFEKEYRGFYHTIDGEKVLHYDVHNVYGALMTKAAGDELKKSLDNRYLLFSRSSYIGASRAGGIWTGDNDSSWDHLKHNVYQMPALNMCGLIYSGADTGGFTGNTNEELSLRWHAFSSFTPLFRNHNNKYFKKQECYRFKHVSFFKDLISFRYLILPYLYSEFVKAALNKDMFIRPLCFIFDEDEKVRNIEDQLMVGENMMVAPIIEQGKKERKVYLPENMTKVIYNGKEYKEEHLEKGEHILHLELNENAFFIRDNCLVPVSNKISNTKDLDLNDITLLGNGNSYSQYIDDGYTKNVSLDNVVVKTK